MNTITIRETDWLLSGLLAWDETYPPYPAGMLAKRRAEFVERVQEWNSNPDCVDGESIVSDEQDARNSRPYPY